MSGDVTAGLSGTLHYMSPSPTMAHRCSYGSELRLIFWACVLEEASTEETELNPHHQKLSYSQLSGQPTPECEHNMNIANMKLRLHLNYANYRYANYYYVKL